MILSSSRSKRHSFFYLLVALPLAFSFLSPLDRAKSDEINRERKIALLFDTGGPGDGSYNDAAREALDIAKKKYSLFEPNVRELVTDGTVGDRIYRLRLMARNGYFMVIAVGSANAEAVRRVSQEYPDLEFGIINDGTVSGLNVSSQVFDDKQAAYMAGFAAALASRSKRVIYVAQDENEMERLGPFFERGVRSAELRAIKKATPGKYQVFISFERSDYKKALDDGFDVIYSTWNLDSAVLNEVIKRNRERSRVKQIEMIGNVPDQYYLNLAIAKPHLLLSVERNVTQAMDRIVRTAVKGEYLLDLLDGTNSVFGYRHTFANGGLTIKYHNKEALKLKAALNSEIARIKSKKVKF